MAKALRQMNKAELLERAQQAGVKADETMTNMEIVTAIEAKPTQAPQQPDKPTGQQSQSWAAAANQVTNPEAQQKQALPEGTELRAGLSKYVNTNGQFRSGLTKEQLEKGKALVRKLGLDMPSMPE